MYEAEFSGTFSADKELFFSTDQCCIICKQKSIKLLDECMNTV